MRVLFDGILAVYMVELQKLCDSVGREEVLYNILIEFEILRK
jgi:hypothetical protein